jgi:cytochrome c oxidase subunit IV
MASAEGQQHPLTIYFWIWGLLFLFSAGSYATDFLPHGYLRWTLIVAFMVAKAGFIVAIFMHMKWERLALMWAILGPPIVLLELIGLMAVEGDYTELTRLDFFSAPLAPAGHEAGAHEAAGEAH